MDEPVMPPIQTTGTTPAVMRKNLWVAYILWFFLGQLGAHRFYLGKPGTAAAQLVLAVLGWLTAAIRLGVVFLFPLWFWLFVDLFLIPQMARTTPRR